MIFFKSVRLCCVPVDGRDPMLGLCFGVRMSSEDNLRSQKQQRLMDLTEAVF